MQAGSIKLFGVNEWALRLWPALLALAGCLAVYGAGRKLFGRRAGLIAAIVLATSPLYYLLARIITLDMAVSVLLTGALLSFLLGVREPPGRTRSLYLYAFYALCAAATLTKGLIGIVIPAMVIGAWIVLLWDWRLLRAIHLPTGLLLFFVLAAPWHVLAARANPEFAQFYFIHEHFQRYLTTGTCALPAVVVLRAGAGVRRAAMDRAGFSRRCGPPGPAGARAANSARKFSCCSGSDWCSRFFSVSGSKLIPYILPMLPPSALLLGRYLAPAEPAPEPKGLRSGFWLFLVATAALGAYLAMELSRRPQAQADVLRLGSGAYLMLAGLLLVALAHFFLGRLATVTRPLAVLAAGAALLVLALGAALPVLDDKYSVKALALELKARLLPADEVIILRAYYQDLPVYLARRITVVDWKGELEFGASQQDVSGWMIGEAEFHRRWQSPNTVYMITERKNLDWLRAQGLPHRILKATGDNVLLSNRGPAP